MFPKNYCLKVHTFIESNIMIHYKHYYDHRLKENHFLLVVVDQFMSSICVCMCTYGNNKVFSQGMLEYLHFVFDGCGSLCHVCA